MDYRGRAAGSIWTEKVLKAYERKMIEVQYFKVQVRSCYLLKGREFALASRAVRFRFKLDWISGHDYEA